MGSLHVLYEDNHIIIINKGNRELAQKDSTCDTALDEKIKAYLKEKYNKPGKVYLGVVHRLDRPVSGAIVYAKTSKALSRLNKMFRDGEIQKTYNAIVQNKPKESHGALEHFILRDRIKNKSTCYNQFIEGAKKAMMKYKITGKAQGHYFVDVELQTGRHHQIRAQLSAIGCPIVGDVKYGAAKPNADKGICLHSRQVQFIHPVSKENIKVTAPFPKTESLWKSFPS